MGPAGNKGQPGPPGVQGGPGPQGQQVNITTSMLRARQLSSQLYIIILSCYQFSRVTLDPRDQLENKVARERGGLGDNWVLLGNQEPLAHKETEDQVDNLVHMDL